MGESLIAFEMETSSMDAFGAQSFVVVLWALGEQVLWRALTISEAEVGTAAGHRSYPWSRLRERYARLGVEFANLKSFEEANECRILTIR